MEIALSPLASVLSWEDRGASFSLGLTLCLANAPSPEHSLSTSQRVSFLASAVVGGMVGPTAE